MIKRCKRCGVRMEATRGNFYRHYTNKDRLSGVCKACHAKTVRAYRAKNRAALVKSTRRWAKKNAAHVAEYQAAYYLKNKARLQAAKAIRYRQLKEKK